MHRQILILCSDVNEQAARLTVRPTAQMRATSRQVEADGLRFVGFVPTGWLALENLVHANLQFSSRKEEHAQEPVAVHLVREQLAAYHAAQSNVARLD